MLGSLRTWSAILALSLVALGGLATCSSSARQDGESCDKNTDCVSGRCSAGACEGSDCTCDGPDCRGRSTCQAGWLCTRSGATTTDVIPRCRMQCSADAGACPSDKHCENGVCAPGPAPFALAWVNIPRAPVRAQGPVRLRRQGARVVDDRRILVVLRRRAARRDEGADRQHDV